MNNKGQSSYLFMTLSLIMLSLLIGSFIAVSYEDYIDLRKDNKFSEYFLINEPIRIVSPTSDEIINNNIDFQFYSPFDNNLFLISKCSLYLKNDTLIPCGEKYQKILSFKDTNIDTMNINISTDLNNIKYLQIDVLKDKNIIINKKYYYRPETYTMIIENAPLGTNVFVDGHKEDPTSIQFNLNSEIEIKSYNCDKLLTFTSGDLESKRIIKSFDEICNVDDKKTFNFLLNFNDTLNDYFSIICKTKINGKELNEDVIFQPSIENKNTKLWIPFSNNESPLNSNSYFSKGIENEKLYINFDKIDFDTTTIKEFVNLNFKNSTSDMSFVNSYISNEKLYTYKDGVGMNYNYNKNIIDSDFSVCAEIIPQFYDTSYKTLFDFGSFNIKINPYSIILSNNTNTIILNKTISFNDENILCFTNKNNGVSNLYFGNEEITNFNFNLKKSLNTNNIIFGNTFEGYFDNFKIYKRIINKQEISNLGNYLISSKINNGIYLNSDYSYIEKDVSSIPILNKGTISFWFKNDGNSSGTILDFKGEKPKISIDDKINIDWISNINIDYNKNEYNYFLMEWDGITMNFYINNEIKRTIALSPENSYLNNNLIIGENTSIILDDLRIFNNTLSTIEKNKLYNDGNGNGKKLNYVLNNELYSDMNDYFEYNYTMTNNDEFSLSFWFETNDFSDREIFNLNNLITLKIQNSKFDLNSNTIKIPEGKNQYIFIVDNNTLKIYINGVLMKTNTISKIDINNLNNIKIKNLNSKINDLRLFNLIVPSPESLYKDGIFLNSNKIIFTQDYIFDSENSNSEFEIICNDKRLFYLENANLNSNYFKNFEINRINVNLNNNKSGKLVVYPGYEKYYSENSNFENILVPNTNLVLNSPLINNFFIMYYESNDKMITKKIFYSNENINY